MAATKWASMAIFALLSFAVCSRGDPPTPPPSPSADEDTAETRFLGGIRGGFIPSLDVGGWSNNGGGGGRLGVTLGSGGNGGLGVSSGNSVGNDGDSVGRLGVTLGSGGNGGLGVGSGNSVGNDGGRGGSLPGSHGSGWGGDNDGFHIPGMGNEPLRCVPNSCYNQPGSSACNNAVSLYFDYHVPMPMGSNKATPAEVVVNGLNGDNEMRDQILDAMAPETS